MSRTIAFDTYAFVKELKSAGLSEEQAEAQSTALSKALEAFQEAHPGLTLSWVNKLGSEDSGAPPADSPGTSSRVVRTSFASIPGLSL